MESDLTSCCTFFRFNPVTLSASYLIDEFLIPIHHQCDVFNPNPLMCFCFAEQLIAQKWQM